MMNRISMAIVPLLILVVAMPAWTGCDRSSDTEQAEATAAPIGHAECAACGMTVGHQPAPRAQVVHSDGTREYLCSISDLIHYATVPSPHGRITATFVEVMEADADPQELATDERPWRAAEQTNYVIGVQRPRIMGPPVLTYEDAETAGAAAQAHEGTAVSWSELQTRLHEEG